MEPEAAQDKATRPSRAVRTRPSNRRRRCSSLNVSQRGQATFCPTISSPGEFLDMNKVSASPETQIIFEDQSAEFGATKRLSNYISQEQYEGSRNIDPSQNTTQLIHWYDPQHESWLTQSAESEWTGWSTTGSQLLTESPWTPWKSMLDQSDAPYQRWYSGAATNAAFNEIDRHVMDGFGRRQQSLKIRLATSSFSRTRDISGSPRVVSECSSGSRINGTSHRRSDCNDSTNTGRNLRDRGVQAARYHIRVRAVVTSRSVSCRPRRGHWCQNLGCEWSVRLGLGESSSHRLLQSS